MRLQVALASVVFCTPLALAFSAAPASASCAEPSAAAATSSDVVFSGVVSRLRQSGGDRITTVRVDQVFKGEVTRRVDVTSPADEVEATIEAAEGERLIVFADRAGDSVSSTLCRTVTDPTYVESIVAELGPGSAPDPGYLKAARGPWGLTYDQFVAGRALLGAVGLVCVALLAWRAWRARMARRRTS